MNFLEKARRERGFSQGGLAGCAKVSRSQIIRIEAGKVDIPRPGTIKRLAEGLGMTEGELRAAMVSSALKKGVNSELLKNRLRRVK